MSRKPVQIPSYKREEELLLKEWSERAMVYRVLHHKSWSAYRRQNHKYTIPIIILSTVAGTANVAQSRIPEQYMAAATIGIGFINLLSAILTTIANFLEVAKLEQAHRTASQSWGKFARHWATELARAPQDRVPVTEAMRQSKAEFDRLMELSPPIPQEIINEFTTTHQKKPLPPNFARPEIVDEYREIKIYVDDVSENSPRLVAKAVEMFHGGRKRSQQQDTMTSVTTDQEDEIHPAVV